MEPEQWLAQYQKRLTDIATRANEAGDRLKQVGGTATSPYGEVTVTVGAGGALEDLTLTPAARGDHSSAAVTPWIVSIP